MEFSTILAWLVGGLGAVLFAVIVVGIGQLVARALRDRRPAFAAGWRKSRIPLGLALLFSGLRLTWAAPDGLTEQSGTIQHGLLIGAIITWVWFVGSVVLTLIDLGLQRTPTWVDNAPERRRIITQLHLVRRLVSLIFVIIGIGGVLLTFPGVEQIGGGILASAGLISVIAGLAAQTSLANLFAGIQLAFSEALKIGDIVVIEDEYGTVEEITLTYVVIQIWDDRRMVLPTTYFNTTPYTNWTRQGSKVTGTVYFTLDWQIDLDGMRAKLAELLEASPDWNRHSGGLVVTDAINGFLEVRVSASADDPDKLWNLRCMLREELAKWVREHNPDGLPGHRLRKMPPPRTEDQ